MTDLVHHEIMEHAARRCDFNIGAMCGAVVFVLALSQLASADHTVIVFGRDGRQGSGVVVDERGYVLTAEHVVSAGVGEVKIDGRSFSATVIYDPPRNGRDEAALIKVELPARSHLKSERIATSRPQQFEWVTSEGFPGGQYATLNGSLTRTAGHDHNQDISDPVYTSLRPMPGHSGGPLYNSDQQVIGLASHGCGTFIGLRSIQKAMQSMDVTAISGAAQGMSFSSGESISDADSLVDQIVVFSTDQCDSCERFSRDLETGKFGKHGRRFRFATTRDRQCFESRGHAIGSYPTFWNPQSDQLYAGYTGPFRLIDDVFVSLFCPPPIPIDRRRVREPIPDLGIPREPPPAPITVTAAVDIDAIKRELRSELISELRAELIGNDEKFTISLDNINKNIALLAEGHRQLADRLVEIKKGFRYEEITPEGEMFWQQIELGEDVDGDGFPGETLRKRQVPVPVKIVEPK